MGLDDGTCKIHPEVDPVVDLDVNVRTEVDSVLLRVGVELLVRIGVEERTLTQNVEV